MSYIIIAGKNFYESKYGINTRGNGYIIYDREQQEAGDYKNVAHITSADNKEVKNGKELILNLYTLKNNFFIHRFAKKHFPKSHFTIINPKK
jgi:hypothetical protein